ncbi:MAG: DNA mismatch repair endonuclease MutL, partial [Psychrilyobacter sp.]|nr:DNA mismatch repair endonuclease MutL [Psychrilyobacter sp.]
MNKIKILDESVSNIIAAGEVVENPASMIKELIENSLDAKAKTIRVEVKNSGRDVRLVDTGIGMEKEDLFLCVERHATSKIKEKEDLFNLISYGFRGEALASIGSISKMIISTKTETSKIGHKINLNAGRVTKYEEISKVVGTEISIKDLFFNTPARLKFLRKKSTEYARIREIVLKEALYNCDVSFILVLDGREVVKTSGRGMENVILELFGRLTLKNSNKFSLGYWGNMELLKSNKESIYTFVNGRYVKSKTIEKAILDGYYTKLTKGKYPFAIIFFDISPEKVDVNVHPSKKIVKFVDEEGVYKEVLSQISEAIYSNDRDSSKTLTVEEISNNIIVKNDVIKTNQGTFELIDTNKASNNENRTITPEEHIENPETLKNKVLERIAKASQNSYDEKEYSVPIIPSFDLSTPDTEQIEEVQSEYSEKEKVEKDIKSKEEFLEDQVSI